MRILRSEIFSISIPFRFQFNHHLKRRKFSESIIVKITDEQGNIGYGEGAPRNYVTGESSEMCISYFENSIVKWLENYLFPDNLDGHDEFIEFLRSWHTKFPEIKHSEIIAWNSIRCATELAVIDCFLNRTKQCLSKYFPPKRSNIIFSGAIPSVHRLGAGVITAAMKIYGVIDLKIKLNRKNDLQRIQTVRFIAGAKARLRVDANMAFSFNNIEDRKTLFALDRENLESIEQPFGRGNINEWKDLKKSISTDLMVDESLITLEDARMLMEHKACDAFNLRLSRLGGIYFMLEFAKIAESHNIWYQIGSHVGETGILASVGQHIAAYLYKARFLEGSVGALLLQKDIVNEKVQMGYGGLSHTQEGFGFGVTVNSDTIKKFLKI